MTLVTAARHDLARADLRILGCVGFNTADGA
jgi:hypothetical protein